jgi:hypothetical protein
MHMMYATRDSYSREHFQTVLYQISVTGREFIIVICFPHAFILPHRSRFSPGPTVPGTPTT